MTNQDVVLGDSSFLGTVSIPALQLVDFICFHKKSKTKVLTEEEVDFNHQQSLTRSKIEWAFGRLKQKFKMFRGIFHGPARRHQKLVRIRVAIYNGERKMYICTRTVAFAGLVN